jgi:5-formyltetrahydrofolate cyclo-ligase
MHNIVREKKKIRESILLKRDSMEENDVIKYSASICKTLESLFQISAAQNIMTYWPIKNEVQTQSIIEHWSKHKKIYLPVIRGNNIYPGLFTGIQHLRRATSFNIPEPVSDEYTSVEQLDVIIVPGVAFDHKKNRLGYGKGFYDRFLTNKHIFTIGICFDIQLVDELPVNDSDIPVQMVITEKGIIQSQ